MFSRRCLDNRALYAFLGEQRFPAGKATDRIPHSHSCVIAVDELLLFFSCCPPDRKCCLFCSDEALTISLAADCDCWSVPKNTKVKALRTIAAKPEMFQFHAHTSHVLGSNDPASTQVIQRPSTFCIEAL
jgi:hypothetical protein